MTLPSAMIGSPPGEAKTPGSVAVADPALVDRVGENARRAPIGRSGPRLANGDVHAGGLRVVHALEVHQETVIIDHGDSNVPSVLLAFGENAGSDLLCGHGIDRRAIFRALVLGRCADGKATSAAPARIVLIFHSSPVL